MKYGGVRLVSKEKLHCIMMTCIILHNMIVEDERDEYEAEPFDPNDNLTDPRRAEIYERENRKTVEKIKHNKT